jgi:hypothetical protein
VITLSSIMFSWATCITAATAIIAAAEQIHGCESANSTAHHSGVWVRRSGRMNAENNASEARSKQDSDADQGYLDEVLLSMSSGDEDDRMALSASEREMQARQQCALSAQKRSSHQANRICCLYRKAVLQGNERRAVSEPGADSSKERLLAGCWSEK